MDFGRHFFSANPSPIAPSMLTRTTSASRKNGRTGARSESGSARRANLAQRLVSAVAAQTESRLLPSVTSPPAQTRRLLRFVESTVTFVATSVSGYTVRIVSRVCCAPPSDDTTVRAAISPALVFRPSHRDKIVSRIVAPLTLLDDLVSPVAVDDPTRGHGKPGRDGPGRYGTPA